MKNQDEVTLLDTGEKKAIVWTDHERWGVEIHDAGTGKRRAYENVTRSSWSRLGALADAIDAS